MVNRHARHRGVEDAVIERKIVGGGSDRRSRSSGPLGAHRRARLDSQQPAIQRLVGARARPHVDHGARVPERLMDARCDPGIGRLCRE